eukprot:1277719-Rhodomonas_salina.5
MELGRGLQYGRASRVYGPTPRLTACVTPGTKLGHVWYQNLQSFHRQIAQDKEIVKIVLLLTGGFRFAAVHPQIKYKKPHHRYKLY